MSTLIVRSIILLAVGLMLVACEQNPDPNISSLNMEPFAVPEDGKLTEKQIVDYISIRQQINRELEKRNQAEPNSSDNNAQQGGQSVQFRYFDEIEKATAQAHGMSYPEYRWVKETIISTQTDLWLKNYYELNQRIMNLLDKTLVRYRQINANEDDKKEQQLMDDYVLEMKQELSILRQKIKKKNVDPDVSLVNSGLVNKYKQELESLGH